MKKASVMPNSVFWSWQSDLSARETRNVVREALSAAIEQLAGSFEEADRPELDHDTRGVPGIPEIAATILDKIDAAAAFVADVTPICVNENDKQLANPNVLIELGYAKKSLGSSRIVLVWNTAIYGSRPEDLPFDLRHRRGPISFSLAEGADKSDLRAVREELTRRFVDDLGSILRSVPPPLPAEPEWWPSEENELGVWKGNGHGIPVNLGGDGVSEITVDEGGMGFARIIPSGWNMREDAIGVLEHATQHPIPLGRWQGLNWGPCTSGFLVFRQTTSTDTSGITTTATRWFRDTGELWGVDANFLSDDGGTLVYAELFAAERWLAWLKNSAALCRILGGTYPFTVRLGVTQLRGARWAFNHPIGSVPQGLEQYAFHEATLPSEDEAEIRELVRQTLNKVRSAFGMALLSREGFQNLAIRGG